MIKWLKDRNTRLGLAFISPWLIGFALFNLYPLVSSFVFSLCQYDGMREPVFIGAQNYIELAQDDRFWTSLWNTMYMVMFGLPFTLLIALILALLLNQNRRGISIYRTLFYMPTLMPIVAMAILWQWLLNPEVGLINYLITLVNDVLAFLSGGMLRLPLPGWMASTFWSKPALVLMGIWGAGGTTLIYLASLQDVPTSLYESADIDGASWWTKLRHITLPMISPVIFFNLIMGLITMFQYFTQVYVLTDGTGSPQDSTLFSALYLFNEAFTNWTLGYASAMAWIQLLIILALTGLVFWTARRMVHYRGV
jgi:multiple sugar transport system permease protein